MPNELFGSVGFALSADRRRPKTLGRRLTIKKRRGKLAFSLVVTNLKFFSVLPLGSLWSS